MSDRLSGIEARLQRLEAAIDDLRRDSPSLVAIERRLVRLEAREAAAAASSRGPDESTHADADESRAGFGVPDVGPAVALVGRTLFVLAGAFLLRALTDSGQLDGGLGVLLGLAFATTWIVMADRAGGRRRSASAAFHGLAFVLIAFPLLFEATTRFHFLNSVTAAAGLGGCTAIALTVGWRRQLQGLTWVASLGGVATATALAVATRELGPFALFLVLLGVAALWLGYLLEWTLLRWPLALFADLAVLILSLRAGNPASADTPGMALSAQIVLLVAYLGSFATRTLLLNRNVIPFEVAQSVAATLAGLGGAAALTHAIGGGVPLGIATLVLASGCYAAAAVFVERRQSRRRNYYFYTSAGLVFALAGGALAMPSPTVGPVYAVFGVVAAWAGRLSGRTTFRAHGAAYLTAAVAATGLLPFVFYGIGLPIVPAANASVAPVCVLALCGVAMWGLRPESGTIASPGRRLPRLVVLVLVMGGLLGTVVSWVLTSPAGASVAGPGFVAMVRTALLVAGILAVALADRAWAFTEGAWLVYPLLVLTGLKFVMEDIRARQPATLFVGFALYGIALIVGPRLCRRPDGARGGPFRPPSDGH